MKWICVVALGSTEEDALAAVEKSLWQAFGFEIRRLTPLGEPAYAYDPQRLQYSSAAVLRFLLDRVPADAARVLAVTEKDLFIPMLSFVFGHAQLNGTVACISLARLRQEFYGLPPNRPLMLARAAKEAVHEIGHTFGLAHCSDPVCSMSLSNEVRHVDRKGAELCMSCSILFAESLKHIERCAGEKR